MRRTILLGACAFAKQGDPGSGFSSGSPVAYLTPLQAADFAKQIGDVLRSRGAKLALVFRTGRPRSKLPAGISYTHGAFWTADSSGAFSVHNLYHGDGHTLSRQLSELVTDSPLDFTRGTAVDDVGVIIPAPALQQKTIAVIASPDYERMHVRSYSLIANPLDPKHQNCNEFMLDVLVAAQWREARYDQVKALLKAHYRPTDVRVAWWQRLLGPITDSRIKLDDQGEEIVTATFESMRDFLCENGLLQDAFQITREQRSQNSA